MTKTLRNKIAGMAVLAIAATSLVGCTDEEIAGSIIIGGAIIIGATTHCEGGYKDVCHSYTNYFGVTHTECREVYDSCAYLAPNAAAKIAAAGSAAAAAPAAKASPVNATNWGSAFNISFDSSQALIDALKAAKAGDSSALEKMGMSSDESARLAVGASPSAAGLDAMAKALDTTPATVTAMLQRIGAALQQQQRLSADDSTGVQDAP